MHVLDDIYSMTEMIPSGSDGIVLMCVIMLSMSKRQKTSACYDTILAKATVFFI